MSDPVTAQNPTDAAGGQAAPEGDSAADRVYDAPSHGGDAPGPASVNARTHLRARCSGSHAETFDQEKSFLSFRVTVTTEDQLPSRALRQ